MNVIGIDIDTRKIALASYDGIVLTTELIKATNKAFEERYKELILGSDDWMGKKVYKNKEKVVVFIEEPAFVQNRRAVIQLAKVFSVIATLCCLNNVPCFGVNNMIWKKGILGDGRASKEKIKEFALLAFGEYLKGKTQDEMDASLIAKWGWLRLNN